MKFQPSCSVSLPKKESTDFINISVDYIGFWTGFHAILFIVHRLNRILLEWRSSILTAAAEENLGFLQWQNTCFLFFFLFVQNKRKIEREEKLKMRKRKTFIRVLLKQFAMHILFQNTLNVVYQDQIKLQDKKSAFVFSELSRIIHICCFIRHC